jgi:predicted MFS family arabinose efflux permease
MAYHARALSSSFPDFVMRHSTQTLLRISLPFALGYLLSYVFRVVNAVIAPDLTRDLALVPTDLGLLTAAYFFAFAAFQLPLGLLLDRFGPRRVEALLLVVAGVGALLFAAGESLPTLVIARALIGLGVSACLMAAFKAFALWHPPQRLPLVNGIQTAAGGLGALLATAPAAALLPLCGWRGLFAALGVATLASALLLWLSVPEHPEHSVSLPWCRQLADFRNIFRSRTFWRLTPWTVASQAAFLSLQGLWAGPWLRDVAGFNRDTAAGILMATATAMVAGFLVWGALAARAPRHGLRPIHIALTGLALFIAVQLALLVDGTSHPALYWTAFGFCGTAGILPYALFSQAFPRELAGRVNTALNVLVFAAAFAAQWGIGALIDLWVAEPGRSLAGAYQVAFTLLIVLQLCGALWYLLAGNTPERS